MKKTTTIPVRSEIAPNDQWNLALLFKSDKEWENALSNFKTLTAALNAHKKAFSNPETVTADNVQAALTDYFALYRAGDKLGSYASLKKTEDAGNPDNVKRAGTFMMAYTKASEQTSWFEPALITIPEKRLREWIDPSSPSGEKFADYKIYIEKLLYTKPFILSEKEERILALLGEAHNVQQNSFSILTNVDFDFGTITTSDGEKPLTQSTFAQFLRSPDREERKNAYKQFYSVFDAHKNTIATLYAGQVAQNVAKAQIYNMNSYREAALYPDKVPTAVYDNLITTIRKNLAPLHRFYELQKKALNVDELHLYDVHMPLVKDIEKDIPYEEGVNIITEALAPLGGEYTKTIHDGLLGGWVDRYENKGKRSGAFSSGCYDSVPYILVNYKSNVISSLFTLIHEGGHSMHSWYSRKHNPYPCAHYTIFEAEVASTFNEALLFRHLQKTTTDKKMMAYLLSTRISGILSTLYRQTMFAEFEMQTHALAESGTPLTIENLRSEYRTLLNVYFGNTTILEDESDLEGLRIPHFYRAFYVYKYATGISAALTLSERVLNGGEKEREDYFAFLKSGGSRYPTESLAVAGVDMTSPKPIETACTYFADLVTDLEKLLKE